MNKSKMKCRGKGCCEYHTPGRGYFDESEFYKKLTKTHKQIKCKVCGLYTVWVKK